MAKNQIASNLLTAGLEMQCLPSFHPETLYTQYYHYTHAAAKEEIVDGRNLEFRLTKVTDFLDRNEGTSILEPYYHACGHLYETGIIDRDFFLIARSITSQSLRRYKANLWALCLTPHGCSEFMKERYAAKDGWIIAFQSIALDDLRWHFPREYGEFDYFEMQYSFEELKLLMEIILQKCYDAYIKDLAQKVPYTKREVRGLLLRSVHYYGLRYKAEMYKHEKELRLVFSLNNDFSDWKSEDKKLKVVFERKNKKEILRLSFNEFYFYKATAELNILNDERLNNGDLKGTKIQKVLESDQ